VCAVFKVQGATFRPGREFSAVGPNGLIHRVWAGFARSEILNWWIQRGGILLDIHAEEFAERSGRSGELGWAMVPPGLVIRAIIDRQTEHEVIKIVTRESAPAELEHFEHNRMPVAGKPLHASAPMTLPVPPPEKPAPPKRFPTKSAPDGLVQEMLFDF
jgi:hypothetical protein